MSADVIIGTTNPRDVSEHTCQWCDRPAVHEATIVPERVVKEVVKEKAITAPVCGEHRLMVQRNYEVNELRKKRRRLQLKVEKMTPTDKKRPPLEHQIIQCEEGLRALGERVDA